MRMFRGTVRHVFGQRAVIETAEGAILGNLGINPPVVLTPGQPVEVEGAPEVATVPTDVLVHRVIVNGQRHEIVHRTGGGQGGSGGGNTAAKK